LSVVKGSLELVDEIRDAASRGGVAFHHTYRYGADGRINPVPTTRQG